MAHEPTLTSEAVFQGLASDLHKLHEAINALHLAIGDKPHESESALADSFESAVLESLASLHEARSAAEHLVSSGLTDLRVTYSWLSDCQRDFYQALSCFSSTLGSNEKWVDLTRLAASQRGEWIPWTQSVKDGINDSRTHLEATNRSLFLCWQELGRSAASMATACISGRPTESAPALEYARRVFDNVTDWYKNADSKAQVLLGLDGGFLAFLTSSVFAKREEVLRVVQTFKTDTWVLLGLMSATLTASIISALCCLWSRTYRKSQVDKALADLGIVKDKPDTYPPEVMWFFQMIRALEKEAYRDRLLNVTKEFEVRVLASQIYELSRNVSRKHFWINLGFTFAGTSLVLFVAAIVSYLIRARP
jgi:hypothetical protein